MSGRQTHQQLLLATRRSPLALAQSQMIATAIEQAVSGVHVALQPMTTQGDVILDRPLREVGGKALFTKGVEEAVLTGQADLAVHSLKDMDTVSPPGLEIVAYPVRENPHDVIVTPDGCSLEQLAPGAVIGTSGLRRVAQLRAISRQFDLRPLRGNINSRLAKLDAGEFDAIVLAAAGLKRAGYADRIGQGTLSMTQVLSAAGQGILAVQMLTDHPLKDVVSKALNHQPTYCQALAERTFLAGLAGNCFSPVAAYCALNSADNTATLTAYLAPTVLGENRPLSDEALVAAPWRQSLRFETSPGAAAFQQAGAALARQAKTSVPNIFANWSTR